MDDDKAKWKKIELDPAYTSFMEYLDRLRKEMWAMSGINEADLGDVTVQGNHSSLGYQPTEWMKKYYGGTIEKLGKKQESYRERLMMMGRRPGKNFVVTGVDESGKLQFSSLPALMRDALNEEDDNPYISEEVLHEKIQGPKVDFFDFESKPLISPEPQESDDPNGVYHRDWLRYIPKEPLHVDMELTPYGTELFRGLGGTYEKIANRDADGNIVSWTHTFTNFIPATFGEYRWWQTKKPKLKRGHKSGRKHPYRTKQDRVRYQKR